VHPRRGTLREREPEAAEGEGIRNAAAESRRTREAARPAGRRRTVHRIAFARGNRRGRRARENADGARQADAGRVVPRTNRRAADGETRTDRTGAAERAVLVARVRLRARTRADHDGLGRNGRCQSRDCRGKKEHLLHCCSPRLVNQGALRVSQIKYSTNF